jgi:2,4-dienoyl-CoA reductase-like NADH-dependent reductase (Old Yellow Enzyme family)
MAVMCQRVRIKERSDGPEGMVALVTGGNGALWQRICPRYKGRTAVMASGGIKTCKDAKGAIKLGADLVAVGRAVVVDPEWLSKVRSKSEASILAGLPKDELEIAKALSIPARMVEHLLSCPGWIPRL